MANMLPPTPVATQSEVLAHKSASSSSSTAPGVCTAVQLVPFHSSARVPSALPEVVKPTAQHRLADGHATPSSRSDGSGSGEWGSARDRPGGAVPALDQAGFRLAVHVARLTGRPSWR